MTAKAEIEDMLAEASWRERNGLDAMPQIGAAALPPGDLLREHELKTYRDCPLEYEGDSPKVNWALWALVIGILLLGLVIASSHWARPYAA